MSDSEILRGVPAILRFVNQILDAPLSERQVYRAIELRQLPTTGKLLGQHCANKAAIRAALGADAVATPAKTTRRSVL